MQDAYAYCEDLVRKVDKERYLAALFVPAERRPHVFALYAFNAEIARVREVAHEPLPGEIRLQWWRDALAGQGHGEVAGNPVAAALIDTVERFALPREALHGLIDAHAFDLYDEPMATLPDLEDYARKTSSIVLMLATQILDANAAGGPSRVIDPGGVALGLVSIARAFPFHLARGQFFLPLDLMARHGVSSEAAQKREQGEGVSAALAELRARARIRLADSGFLQESAGSQAPALLPLALVEPLLGRLGRQDQAPFDPVELPQWRAQWALWRMARRMR